MKPYSYGPYNKSNENEQWIRLTEGCPHNCPFCYEPQEIKIFKTPEIIRNKVKIMDMNLLAKPEATEILANLPQRLNARLVEYELVCGLDYRFLTYELARLLFHRRFHKIRLAWDWFYFDNIKINRAIKMLVRAGYRSKDLMVFMICNWRVDADECEKKLDLLKVWRVKVCDCYFDNQINIKKGIKSRYWTNNEISKFRRRCRKHNQIIGWGYDPEPERIESKLLLYEKKEPRGRTRQRRHYDN